MTSPHQQGPATAFGGLDTDCEHYRPTVAPRNVDCEVAAQDDIVGFVHNLGGPVDVTAFDAEGNRVGYVLATHITDDEVEVIVVPGTVARLRAELSPDEG